MDKNTYLTSVIASYGFYIIGEEGLPVVYTDLIFIFVFLPIYLILMFAVREAYEKNFVAVAMSIVFILWTRPLYYALILVGIFSVYIAGRLKKRYKPIKIAVAAAVCVSVLPAVFALCCDSSIKGAAAAFGMALFALRSVIYLRESDEYCEKNFIDLCVYLISFEFMCISLLYSYSYLKAQIKSRSAGLAMLAAGLERFIIGLAAVTIPGFALERIGEAAMHSGTVPYLNALIGILAAAVRVYVTVAGYLSMSEGLCLMSGYRIKMRESFFMPRSLMLTHIGYSNITLASNISSLAGEVRPMWMAAASAVLCVIAGAALGLGAPAAAFASIILIACLLQILFETKKSLFSGVFTYSALFLAFLALTGGSLYGIGSWFAAFDTTRYEYDMSYALFVELKRSWVWAVIGLLYILPIRPAAVTLIRKRMSSGEAAYGTLRIIKVVLEVLLLAASAVAVICYAQ